MNACSLQGKVFSLNFTGKTGDFSISASPFELPNAVPALYLNGKKCPFGNWKILKASGKDIQAESENKYGKWHLKFSLSGSDLTIRLGGTLNTSSKEIELYYFDGLEIKADHVLSQGIKMGGCGSVLLNSGKKAPFTGYSQLLLTRNGRQLQLAYPLCCDFLENFSGTPGKKRVTDFRAGASIRHFSGRRIELAPLTLRIGSGLELMQDYAKEYRRPEKNFAESVQPGWNSWDYYRWTVTEDEVLANAEFIAKDPVLSKHVKKIIVDDGWQYAYGEWEANSLFPHGMKYLANKIKKLGMQPGLWIAPVIVEPHARIAQLNPEMLAKGENGNPTLCWECMRRSGFLLDPTVEASRRFIRDTFERLLGDGYTYFKLDFLGGLLKARQFTDTKIPWGKLMDLSIGTAYRAVAGRAKMLGCNYLFCGGPDIADSVRVGADIHAKWSNIENNAVSVAALFWANKRLWINDPDFALCRCRETSNDPDLNRLRPLLVYCSGNDTDPEEQFRFNFSIVGKDMTRAQIEVLLSVTLAAGGAVNLSDHMLKLNESGLDLARRTVSAESGEAALPLDIFSTEHPSCWLQKLKRGHRVLLINWDNVPQEKTIDLKALNISARKAVNFWNDKPVRIVNGRISAVLAPRSCLFAVVQ